MNIVGFAGNLGSGKTLAASMVPGAERLQWADPIYRALAAMLEVGEQALRDRTQKEAALPVAGLELVPRHLLRTLGTEWGRELIHPDLWVILAMRKAESLLRDGAYGVAICGTRFPNEVAAIRERGGAVLWVERRGTVQGQHISDRLIGPEDCDAVLDNNGSPHDLRLALRAALETLGWEGLCLAG